MDAKLTLSFDKEIIADAKKFAEDKGISVSRLTEYLYRRITTQPKNYTSIDDIPVSDFIWQLNEPYAEYITTKKSSKAIRAEYYSAKVNKQKKLK
jgi:Family of unknown function (DUF6364)